MHRPPAGDGQRSIVSEARRQILTVGHTAIVYGISASGRLAVAYPSNFTPAQIVHDAPLLARM